MHRHWCLDKAMQNIVYVCKSSCRCVHSTISVCGTADGNTSWALSVLSDQVGLISDWLRCFLVGWLEVPESSMSRQRVWKEQLHICETHKLKNIFVVCSVPYEEILSLAGNMLIFEFLVRIPLFHRQML